jgi:hypothetical protein
VSEKWNRMITLFYPLQIPIVIMITSKYCYWIVPFCDVRMRIHLPYKGFSVNPFICLFFLIFFFVIKRIWGTYVKRERRSGLMIIGGLWRLGKFLDDVDIFKDSAGNDGWMDMEG